MGKVALPRIGRPFPNAQVVDRVPVDCFRRPWPLLPERPREIAPATQVLQPAPHVDQDQFPSDPNPRVDYVPPGHPDEWTAAERKKFREAQSDRLSEHGRNILDAALAELLENRPMFGEPSDQKIDTKREGEMAVGRFKTLPRADLLNQQRAKPHLEVLADEMAAELKSSRSEIRKRLPGYLKKFLTPK